MSTPLVGTLPPDQILAAVAHFGSPLYLYDERTLRSRCRQVLGMPHAFGFHASYAMKANSNRSLLQIIAAEGLGIDASSLNEVRRARWAGVSLDRIMLTSQEIPDGNDRRELEQMLIQGLVYNACSLTQLEQVAGYAVRTSTPISVRVSPGVGSGESTTRNTGDKYSCFGIHREDLQAATTLARARGLRIAQVHVHIGSGGDPARWRENIQTMLDIVDQYFPDATTLNLGGGFREARMPDETAANLEELGHHARQQFSGFAERTGRQLDMSVEPGTWLVAQSGYLVTTVVDRKLTGADGFDFVILDAGMESSTRPLLYGSRHPFYVVSRDGKVLSSEFDPSVRRQAPRVVVGKCCESGDCQTLDPQGNVTPRHMADPKTGDHVVIGGAGAYLASMSLVGYNSYCRPAEVLLREDGTLYLIRKRQALEQLVEGELGLPTVAPG